MENCPAQKIICSTIEQLKNINLYFIISLVMVAITKTMDYYHSALASEVLVYPSGVTFFFQLVKALSTLLNIKLFEKAVINL